MKRLKAAATIILAGVFLASCGSDSDAAFDLDASEVEHSADAEAAGPTDDSPAETGEAAAGSRAAADEADEPQTSVSAVSAVDPAPRSIIYTIDLAIETEDVARASARAAALAEAAGGFVAHETTRGADRATLTLRVPSDKHSALVAELESFGEVRDRSRSAEDVTSDLVDLDARVASQRRSIDRIRVLLDDATDLGDVVRIEAELARREADLDSLLQRREQLSGLAALATVTVTFYADDVPTEEEEPGDTVLGFGPGVSAGWDALVAAGRVAGTAVGAALPFAALFAVVGVPAWLLWRRLRATRLPSPVPDHARIEG